MQPAEVPEKHKQALLWATEVLGFSIPLFSMLCHEFRQPVFLHFRTQSALTVLPEVCSTYDEVLL